MNGSKNKLNNKFIKKKKSGFLGNPKKRMKGLEKKERWECEK